MANRSVHAQLPVPAPPAHEQVPFSRPTTPHAHPLQIGFYGLSNLGYLMARNLATHETSHPVARPPLLVYNRTVAKCEKLVKEVGGEGKVRIAQSAAQLVIECDIIITNLSNDDVVKNVYAGFSMALTQTPPTRNKIFVETSTVYPTLAGELDNLISHFAHSHLVTCPIFGNPHTADKALMVLIMSGDYQSKKEVAYLLVPAVGRKVIDLGGNVEKAPMFKLIGNSIVAGCVEVIAEAQTLSEKSGIGAEAIHNFVKDMLPAVPLVQNSEKMLNNMFDATKGFAIDGAIKDVSHMRRLTSEYDSPMPTIDIVYQHYLTARALHSAQTLRGEQQFNTLDCSAIVVSSRVAAGFDSSMHSKVIKDE